MASNLEQTILDSIGIYEGKDPNTSEKNRCRSCFKDEKEGSLFRCSQCKFVFYCSQKCQRSDWPEHKEDCKELSRAKENMKEEKEKLKSINAGFSFGPPENLFETSVGRFWGLIKTRDYMRARNYYTDLLYDLAYEVESRELWERVAYHQQEMLRLCCSDNLGVRDQLPFVLLALNREDEAFCFCYYWQHDHEKESYEEREARHAASRKGDWLYPKETDARYKDYLAPCPKNKRKYMDLAMLVAVCIIKLRLVAAFDQKKSHNVEQDESPMQVQRIEDNRRQIKELMNQIHANNPSMLPSIINPMPLKSQGLPDYFSPGEPSEAALILNRCNRHWVRVPGAEKLLVDRFGPKPPYNSNIDA